jgi:hypothetical protein
MKAVPSFSNQLIAGSGNAVKYERPDIFRSVKLKIWASTRLIEWIASTMHNPGVKGSGRETRSTYLLDIFPFSGSRVKFSMTPA